MSKLNNNKNLKKGIHLNLHVLLSWRPRKIKELVANVAVLSLILSMSLCHGYADGLLTRRTFLPLVEKALEMNLL